MEKLRKMKENSKDIARTRAGYCSHATCPQTIGTHGGRRKKIGMVKVGVFVRSPRLFVRTENAQSGRPSALVRTDHGLKRATKLRTTRKYSINSETHSEQQIFDIRGQREPLITQEKCSLILRTSKLHADVCPKLTR